MPFQPSLTLIFNTSGRPTKLWMFVRNVFNQPDKKKRGSPQRKPLWLRDKLWREACSAYLYFKLQSKKEWKRCFFILNSLKNFTQC